MRRITVQGKIVPETHLKNTQHKKRAGGVAQVVGHLPKKLEALHSNPSTAKRITAIKKET
jgi:dihydroxyacid dehydratase/phosphogluconate dehydratase